MADRRPRSNLGSNRAAPRRRPAARAAAGAETGHGTPARAAAPRPRLTGRAAILILMIAVLTVSYASSMRAYLEQRSHISALKVEIARTSADIDELEREKQRWQDPAFLEQQARERFQFVFPGEVSYQVLGEDGKPVGGVQDALHDADQVVKSPPRAWWDTAWTSVELAGKPPSAPPGPAAPQQ